MMSTDNKSFMVIGAGPGGLATAILLAKKGFHVTVVDALTSLSQASEDSYPIGLNPRGLGVLDNIDSTGELRKRVASATPIDGWRIYAGSRVIHFPSGTTVGATRGGVTQTLWEIAKAHEHIELRLGWKLTKLDVAEQILHLSPVGTDGDEWHVNVKEDNLRVIACDGVWSKCRRQVQEQVPELEVQSDKWGCCFRLLFSKPNVDCTLNAREHHIFPGCYVAVLENNIWAISLQINDADEHLKCLVSSDDTQENRELLKSVLNERAPAVIDMIDDEEWGRFFTRRTFTGAVVRVSTLHLDEWICFVGDSAHAVLPAVGEGVNCALEDASVLADCAHESNMFQEYNKRRGEDVKALGTYSKFLLDGWLGSPDEKLARLLLTISLQIGKRVGLVAETWNDKSFGTQASSVQRYSTMLQSFENQSWLLLPLYRCVAKVVVGVKRVLTGKPA